MLSCLTPYCPCNAKKTMRSYLRRRVYQTSKSDPQRQRYMPYITILQTTVILHPLRLSYHHDSTPVYSSFVPSHSVKQKVSAVVSDLNMPSRKLTAIHLPTHGLIAAQMSNPAVAKMNINTTASSFLESRSAPTRQLYPLHHSPLFPLIDPFLPPPFHA